MLYQLFLYATTASGNDALVIPHINTALNSRDAKKWSEWSVDRSLKSFPVEEVTQQIERELSGKCKVHLRYPPEGCEKSPFLFIATSYSAAAAVLPRLIAIAAEHGLALYDAERDKSFYNDLVEPAFIQFRSREQALLLAIRKENEPLWKIQEIFRDDYYNPKISCFAVTLRKDILVPFEERVLRFYSTLQAALLPGETLKCEDRCFRIAGKRYEVSFCLEGYKKHPNQRGWMEDGVPRVDLLHRMSCYEALRFVEKECSERGAEVVRHRTLFNEMIERYPNPADRFVRSVNITKAQWKEKKLSVSYSDIGPYGAEIVFHVVPDPFYNDGRHISALKIDEEAATFILPFFEELYPYFRDRYYLADNHVPIELWVALEEKLQKARHLVLNDTFNPALLPYIQQFDLYTLDDHDGGPYRPDPLIKGDPARFLYEHRYEVAHLYDIFLEWSRVQIEYYGEPSEDRMFNVQGP